MNEKKHAAPISDGKPSAMKIVFTFSTNTFQNINHTIKHRKN
ncbi:hypothetical protein [Pelobium manganitolerans]|nr:hypothetical protein [Pelobium manganitolerans]